ncbi:ESCRT-II complex, vps25 subunit [Parathielavia appendiculata]|uniref:ESCRT-II complex subunit VPS25 n=1 Tax=Parathielavia appendiculata TaxID=2587402 RepID=A0AAN6Z8E7_9PEZI|nr:ESCRT-II complex, vps25 subunit [Parathielavia appendiculata]
MSTPPPPINQPSSSPTPFSFPPEYSFPPFFTRQTNLTTHHAQLIKWASLVLSYCRYHRIFKLSLSGNGTTTTSERDTTELFFNRKINRRLSLPDIREVIDFLRKDNRAEYVTSSSSFSSTNTSATGMDGTPAAAGGGGGGDIVWIYWRTPEEWAALVESWVDATGQRGSVLTVYELVEGDGTRGTEFHGLDQELLLKALNVLVKRGKAQVFGQEDSLGVKFF